jgi:hypothetical protein
MAETTEKVQVIEIAGRYYPHEVFLAAMNTVGMEAVERAMPEGISARQLGRNLAALKTPTAAARVRAEALARVAREYAGVEQLGPHETVVARFRPVGADLKNAPTPGLEKPTDPGYIVEPPEERTP